MVVYLLRTLAFLIPHMADQIEGVFPKAKGAFGVPPVRGVDVLRQFKRV
jgi:hypothetical protein